MEEPQQLKEDSGDYFRDPNAARYPKYPTEPAVQAVLAEQPDFPTTGVDIFACGSTVGNLLRFVRGVDKAFRFNVEVVGNTVFFVRKEKAPTELIPDVRGYGHTFPESYTTWEPDVKGSESHQRIVKYTFGGIKCIIRFESDGYHRDLVPKVEARKPKSSGRQEPDAETDLASVMNAASFGSLSQKSSSSDDALQIKPGGQRIPQNAIFDLKTRSAWKEIDMTEIYPRLWVSQISNFIIGYHTRGTFEDIRKQDIRTDLNDWAKENQDALGRLHNLIHKIINYAKGTSNEKLEICRTDLDVLEIRKQAGDGCDALSPAVKSKWTQGKDPPPNTPPASAQEKSQNKLNEKSLLDPWAFDDDDDDEPDFTACSVGCGYCGHCTY